MHNKFLEFSYENRQIFINKLATIKEENISFIYYNRFHIYKTLIFEEYSNYLEELYKTQNLSILYNDLISNYITSIKEQCDTLLFDVLDHLNQCFCIEYNMLVNIHKFSFDIFSINNEIDDKLFFLGHDITKFVKEEYQTSLYDTDYIMFKDLYDTNYFKTTLYGDLFLLYNLTLIEEKKEYQEVFEMNYILKNQKLISQQAYTYMLTSEDALRNNPNLSKAILYPSRIILILVLIFAAIIFFIFRMSV